MGTPYYHPSPAIQRGDKKGAIWRYIRMGELRPRLREYLFDHLSPGRGSGGGQGGLDMYSNIAGGPNPSPNKDLLKILRID